ncbi:MAG: hypothetical protein AAFQ90_01975 [Pseudomonadota bacterium]
MRAIYAFCAPVTLALAGCGAETSGTLTGEDGEEGDYTINRETGETTATIKTDEGTVTMRSGADVPVELPAGFTVYPGAEVVSNTVVNQGKGSGVLLNMSSADSAQKVAAFYKAQAEKAGIKIEMEMSVNEGQIIGGQSAEGLTFSIMATPEGAGTSAQLTIGRQPD